MATSKKTPDTRAAKRSLDYAKGVLELLELDTRLLGMISALLVIWLSFHVLSNGSFLTARNLWNLAVQTSVVGIVATGMVMVIVCRQIDLSVGSVLGFTGMVMAALQTMILPVGSSWNWVVTLLLGLLLGAVIGAFQGYWIAYQRVPAFIVTLAGLLIFRGGAWMVTSGRTVAPLDRNFQLLGGGLAGSIGATWSWLLAAAAILYVLYNSFSTRRRRLRLGFPVKPLWAEIGVLVMVSALIMAFVSVMNAYTQPQTGLARGIPLPFLILLVIALSMSTLVRRSRFGRYVYAIGGNPEAADLAGVKTRQVRFFIFVIMGMLCAVAGAIATARLNAGSNATGTLAELYVIAAAVIGGTSLAGGVGTVSGAVLGAVVMQSLQSGMVLLGLSSPLQQIIIGMVLIIAVWIDVIYRRQSGVPSE